MRSLRRAALVVALLAGAVTLDAALTVAVGGERLIDPYLLLTVWFASRARGSEGMIVGALAGLTQDCLGSVVFGTNFLSKVVVGYVVTLASRRLVPG